MAFIFIFRLLQIFCQKNILYSYFNSIYVHSVTSSLEISFDGCRLSGPRDYHLPYHCNKSGVCLLHVNFDSEIIN